MKSKLAMQVTTTTIALFVIALITFLAALPVFKKTVTTTQNLKQVVTNDDRSLVSLLATSKVASPTEEIPVKHNINYLTPVIIQNIFNTKKFFVVNFTCYNSSGDECSEIIKKRTVRLMIFPGKHDTAYVGYKFNSSYPNGKYMFVATVFYDNDKPFDKVSFSVVLS